jgi:hypothetical protein
VHSHPDKFAKEGNAKMLPQSGAMVFLPVKEKE